MWSLCVEEHYYLIWGVLFAFIPLNRLPKILTVLAILPIGIRAIYRINHWAWLDLPTNMDYFAFGGLAAFALIKYSEKIETWVKRLPKFWSIAFALFATLFILTEWRFLQKGWISIVRPTTLALVFVMLLFLLVPKNSKIHLGKGNFLTWLGTISYGLYLTHTVTNGFVYRFTTRMGFSVTTPTGAIVYTALALMVTILISGLSYRFFEKPFLSLKHRFSPQKEPREAVQFRV